MGRVTYLFPSNRLVYFLLLYFEFEAVAAVVESANDESPHSSVSGVEVTAAARSEIELGPTPAVELPFGEESGNESEFDAEPLASSEGTLEKEKARIVTMTGNAKGDSSESTQPASSGAARRRKSFRREDRLNQALRVRGQTKSHTCLFCGKGFSRYDQLVNHTRVHTHEKPFFCKVCSKEFSRASNLNRHVRFTHTNQRPYKCELCSKRFTQSCDLTTHMRVHTREKPYKCQHCDKSFSQSGTFKRHVMAKNACKKLH